MLFDPLMLASREPVDPSDPRILIVPGIIGIGFLIFVAVFVFFRLQKRIGVARLLGERGFRDMGYDPSFKVDFSVSIPWADGRGINYTDKFIREDPVGVVKFANIRCIEYLWKQGSARPQFQGFERRQ
jgi:hypothetical protein